MKQRSWATVVGSSREALEEAIRLAQKRRFDLFDVAPIEYSGAAAALRIEFALKIKTLNLGPLGQFDFSQSFQRSIVRFLGASVREPVRLWWKVDDTGEVRLCVAEAPWPIALTESNEAFLECIAAIRREDPAGKPVVEQWLRDSLDLRWQPRYSTAEASGLIQTIPADQRRWVFDTRIPPRDANKSSLRVLTEFPNMGPYDVAPRIIGYPELVSDRIESRPGYASAVGLTIRRQEGA